MQWSSPIYTVKRKIHAKRKLEFFCVIFFFGKNSRLQQTLGEKSTMLLIVENWIWTWVNWRVCCALRCLVCASLHGGMRNANWLLRPNVDHAIRALKPKKKKYKQEEVKKKWRSFPCVLIYSEWKITRFVGFTHTRKGARAQACRNIFCVGTQLQLVLFFSVDIIIFSRRYLRRDNSLLS